MLGASQVSGVARLLVLALALSALLLAGCGGAGLEQVRLDNGPVVGTVAEVDGRQVWAFKGIPYAAPPVGDLRWEAPQPVDDWSEPRDCSQYGPSCPQSTMLSGLPFSTGDTDEDCLYLNVWSPARGADEGLPVMVWIHGGSFETGSGSMGIYEGSRLAARGMVVVTMNYRLGPFGFLSHPDLSAESESGTSGNYGLLDQIEALQWVQRNAGAFGGDPGNVTVFGESAGGISILDLMVSPSAEGLFQRAIVQSGVLMDQGFGMSMAATQEEAETSGVAFAERLGVDPDSDAAEQMRAKTAGELLEAARVSTGGTTGGTHDMERILVWKPVVDGQVLPAMPTKLWMEGSYHRVSLMIGSNADEGDLFTFATVMSRQEYEDQVQKTFAGHADEVLALYQDESLESPTQAINRILTEMGFASSARFAARLMAGGPADPAEQPPETDDGAAEAAPPVYLYEFTYSPLVPLMGAFHAVELPYVFGTIDELSWLLAAGAESEEFSDTVMGYWTRFAATGDPNGGEAPYWPSYDVDTDLHLSLGETIGTGSGLYEQACDLADRIRGWK